MAEITDPKVIDAVWSKGEPVKMWPDFRKDTCGALMQKSALGQSSAWGWRIGHKIPPSKGGTDDVTNLIPLQWKNFIAKGDMPENHWKCAIRD